VGRRARHPSRHRLPLAPLGHASRPGPAGRSPDPGGRPGVTARSRALCGSAPRPGSSGGACPHLGGPGDGSAPARWPVGVPHKGSPSEHAPMGSPGQPRGEPPSRATPIRPRRSGSMSGCAGWPPSAGTRSLGSPPGRPHPTAGSWGRGWTPPAGCARRGSLGRGRGAGDRPRRPWPSSAGSFVTRSAGTARRWWRPSGTSPARGSAMAAAWSRTSGGTSTGHAKAVGRATGAMTTPRSIWRGTRPGHPTKLAWWGPRPTAQLEPP